MRVRHILFRAAALLLAVCLLLPLAGCDDEPDMEIIEKPSAEQAQIGDVVYGFVLEQVDEIAALQAKCFLWRHEQTGAEAYFVVNDDPDCGFGLSFRTQPEDDTGKANILQRAIRAASADYPGINVFSQIADRTYVTQVGTEVADGASTCYVTSLSEDQLERIADFYLDCAFHAAVQTQPNYFLREGWYEALVRADAPIQIGGTVYQDRSDVYSDISAVHKLDISAALFPDTYRQFDALGDPEQILTLTHEEMMDYYKRWYHPSNAMSVHYGNVEVSRWLKRLNIHYSEYQAQEQKLPAVQTPFAEPVTASFAFPVAQNVHTKNTVSYAVALPDQLTGAELTAMEWAVAYLQMPSSELLQQLRASGIGGSYAVSMTYTGPQPVIAVTASEVEPTQAEQFGKLVRDLLAQLCTEGLQEEKIRGLYDGEKLQTMLARNTEGMGIAMAQKLTQVVSTGNQGCFDPWTEVDAAYALCKDGGMAKLLRQYICDNPHAALVNTEPTPGLRETKYQALQQQLQEKKTAMTSEEVAQKVQKTGELFKWMYLDHNAQTEQGLSVQSVEQISAQLRSFDSQTVEEGGVRYRYAKTEGDVAYCKVIYDLSHLTLEQVRALNVYIGLIGEPTQQMNQAQLDTACAGLLADLQVQIGGYKHTDGTAYPGLEVSFFAQRDKMKTATALVAQMLRETVPSGEGNSIRRQIYAQQQRYSSMARTLREVATPAALAVSSEPSQVEYRIFHPDYSLSLQNMRNLSVNEAAAQLQQVRDAAFAGGKVTAYLAADTFDREALTALLPEGELQGAAADWSELPAVQHDAMAIKSKNNVSHCVSMLNIGTEGIAVTGDLILCMELLRQRYYAPHVYNETKAGSVSMSLAPTGVYMLQVYRAETFPEVILGLDSCAEELPGQLEQMGYADLLSCQYTALVQRLRPSGVLYDAMLQLQYEDHGADVALQQQLLDQIVQATPRSVAAQGENLKKIVDAAAWVVIAPGEEIDENAYLIDEMVLLP